MLINLMKVFIAFGLFALAVLANIIVSTYYNTTKLKQSFSFKKLLDGVIKMLTMGIGAGVLSIIVTFISNMAFGDITSEIISISAILVLYGKATVKYYTEAYNTLQDILENRNIIDDAGKDITVETKGE